MQMGMFSVLKVSSWGYVARQPQGNSSLPLILPKNRRGAAFQFG